MIFSMIIKNLKVIVRSPFTIILLILAPILLMFVVGFTYSGNFLTDTHVGLIATDKAFFNINGVESVFYNSGGFEESRNACIRDLKQSELELCVYFSPVYDSSNNLVSAKITYFIDNTRPQISEIIIRNFNDMLDSKTKEISTKTVEDIFVEIKDTISFMKQSKDLIKRIKDDLNSAKVNVDKANAVLVLAKKEFDSSYNDIIDFRDEYQNSIKNIDGQLSLLENSLDEMDDAQYNLKRQVNILNSALSQLEYYANMNPEVDNYVNLNSLEDSIEEINGVSNMLIIYDNQVTSLVNTINNANLDVLEDSLNDMISTLADAKDYLNEGIVELNKVSSDIDERLSEINKIEGEMDKKLEYLTELSSKDASQVTQPITKENEVLFKNFKRVHQMSPMIVVLVLLFIGLLLSNVIVSIEINSKAYFRNLISPANQWKFILSLFCTSVLIIFVQVFFLFLVLHYFFGINVMPNFIPVVVILFHLLVIFILIGIFLAYVFSSIQISILVTTFVILFLFLLSDIIVPIELMPAFFASLLVYNPVIIGENLIRLIFFFNSFQLTIREFFIFYVYIIVLVLFIWFASSRRKKKMF